MNYRFRSPVEAEHLDQIAFYQSRPRGQAIGELPAIDPWQVWQCSSVMTAGTPNGRGPLRALRPETFLGYAAAGRKIAAPRGP